MGRGTVRTKKKLNRSGRYEVWIGGGISQGVGIYRVQRSRLQRSPMRFFGS